MVEPRRRGQQQPPRRRSRPTKRFGRIALAFLLLCCGTCRSARPRVTAPLGGSQTVGIYLTPNMPNVGKRGGKRRRRKQQKSRKLGRMWRRRATAPKGMVAMRFAGSIAESLRFWQMFSLVTLQVLAAQGRSYCLCSHLAVVQEKGSGTVVRSTLRAVPATVPDPFF